MMPASRPRCGDGRLDRTEQRPHPRGPAHVNTGTATGTDPRAAKKGIWQEFKEFLNKGDFVTIAVGLIFALYLKADRRLHPDGIIFPIIAAIFGKPDFSDIGFTINHARFSIGLVIDAMISFVVVGLILFLIVKA